MPSRNSNANSEKESILFFNFACIQQWLHSKKNLIQLQRVINMTSTLRISLHAVSGIKFFDILIWLFGNVQRQEVHLSTATKTSGYIELEKARVRWYLSIDSADIPQDAQKTGKRTYRSLTMDGQEIEFSD